MYPQTVRSSRNRAKSRSDLCSALVLEDPPFFSCQGERRKSAFNYVDLSTVCHDFLNQSQETDFVLYYFSRQRIWEFFPLQARERLRPRSIAAAKYRRKHPDRDCASLSGPGRRLPPAGAWAATPPLWRGVLYQQFPRGDRPRGSAAGHPL